MSGENVILGDVSEVAWQAAGNGSDFLVFPRRESDERWVPVLVVRDTQDSVVVSRADLRSLLIKPEGWGDSLGAAAARRRLWANLGETHPDMLDAASPAPVKAVGNPDAAALAEDLKSRGFCGTIFQDPHDGECICLRPDPCARHHPRGKLRCKLLKPGQERCDLHNLHCSAPRCLEWIIEPPVPEKGGDAP